MFFKLRAKPSAAQPPESPALSSIAAEASVLRQPSSSLYYACLHERLHTQQTELAVVDAAIERVSSAGFAAAVRLTSLDAPERVVFAAYTELITGKAGA